MMMHQQTWQKHYLDCFYRRRKNWINGTQQFHELIQKYLSKDKHILELGPGSRNQTSTFLCDNFASLDSLDIDKEARQNPALRFVHIYNGGGWPIADESYDAVVADYVLEHLEMPKTTVSEAFRVLRPGGLFIFRTPNLWHYVSMASFFTPHWFHKLVANRLRNLSLDSHDPYPTYYRMNRCRKIRDLMRRAGFNEVELLLIEKEPSYGMYSRILFFLFMAYERLVNFSELFSMFRANILGVFAKP
jgi:SAM-dependent methyltransferase